MSKEYITQKIVELEKQIKVTEDMRTEALTKKKMYEESLKEKEEALKKLGTTPENAEEKMKELEASINEKIKFMEDNLPLDLLRKWGKIN